MENLHWEIVKPQVWKPWLPINCHPPSRRQDLPLRRSEYGFREYGVKCRAQRVFGPDRVPGTELGEFLSACSLCAKASFS